MDSQKVVRKWQKRWKDAKLFEPEQNKQEKYLITVPYPYISGSLHIGHARVVTEADVFARFQRMSGKNVLFPMAFHISGTPVLGISLGIEKKDPKMLALYTEYVKAYINDGKEVEKIVQSFKDPQKIVDFFIPKMVDEFSLLGLSVDWRRSFTSGEGMHQKMVEWLFKKYKENGYLMQGKYPVLFSLTLNNAVGEDDIKDGDLDPVEKQDFVLLKFAFEDGFVVAGTVRPETMFGQTNLWVNPQATYVKAKVDGETWYVSKDCVTKLQYQEHKVIVEKELSGSYFLNKKAITPFIARDVVILEASFVKPNICTGFVTSVPSDAPFDYIALQQIKSQIKPISIIQTKGFGDFPAMELCKKMKITSLSQETELKEATQELYKAGFHTGILKDNCGRFSGMTVSEARKSMRDEALKDGFGVQFYETSRSAVSRDGGDVIVAMLDQQWFIDFTAKGWKENAKKCLDGMTIQPDVYRKMFEDTFAWLERRPCARRRGLGTKLPFDTNWVIESLSDSTVYMSLYPIAHLLREHKIKDNQMSEEFFDFVFNGHGALKDVAKSTGVNEQALKELRQSFDYWYPIDHRHTFPPHLPNHLSFMIFAHVAAFDKKYWPKKVSFHGMVLSEGVKMSKSKGNTVTLLELDREYGADVFRAFLCSTTSVESTMNWDKGTVSHVQKHLESLFELASELVKSKKKGESPAWALSQFERLKKKASECIARMDLRGYSMVVLYDIPPLLKKAQKLLTEQQMQAFANLVSDWIVLLSPLVPHLAEELNELDRGKGFVSIATWL